MIFYPLISSIVLKTSSVGLLLEEEPIPEIHFANLTDWGWILLLSIVSLVIWGMIVFQAKSKGSHPFGLVSGTDDDHHDEEH